MTKKILLADDSVTIQKVISITFAGEEFDLTTVGDGNSAISKVKEITPDIVLADVSMPGKDGYQVCKEIKEDPDLKNTPVLLLAGTFEPYDEKEGKKAGADDYIVKPFESQELIDKVNTLLAGRGEVDSPESFEKTQEDEDVLQIPSEEAEQTLSAVPTEVEEQAAALSNGGAEAVEGGEEEWNVDDIGDFLEIEEEAMSPEEKAEEETPHEEDKVEDTSMSVEEGFEDLLKDEISEEPAEEQLEEEKPAESVEEEDLEIIEDVELLEDIEPVEIIEEDGEKKAEEASIEEKVEGEALLEESVFEETLLEEGEERIEEEVAIEKEVQEEASSEKDIVEEQAAKEPLNVDAVLEEKIKESLKTALSPEKVEETVNRVVREVVEEVAWDIAPGLIEEMVKEETNKIKDTIKKIKEIFIKE